MKINIDIKNRFTGKILFEFESENNTIKETVLEAIKAEANLSKANLSWANLSGANLSEANLSKADLSVIKADFFYVLLHALNEIEFLKQNVIEGKIDGSTYSGECACLSGTVEKSAIIHNGEKEEFNKKLIMSCRDSDRPAERFFLAIRPGDKPENHPASKIIFEWINEFQSLIKPN